MTQPSTPTSDRLILFGVAVFAVGALAALAALVPLFVGSQPLPTWVYLASVLAPVGLGLMFWGLWRTARRHGKRTRAAE